MTIYLLFIDGVGLGDPSNYNPWYVHPTPNINQLLSGKSLTKEAVGFHKEYSVLLAADAGLGVHGIPQSATGQASIFTGRNAPKAMGMHQSGLPFKRLREWILEDHLYEQIRNLGKTVTFANSYTPDFYERPATKRGLLSVTTILAQTLPMKLRMYEDLLSGEAVYHDLTRNFLQKFIPDVPLITPEQAASHLKHIGENFHVVVHEFFLSDRAGHKFRTMPELIKWVVDTYDRFLGALAKLRSPDDWVILVSDHGNSEDLRVPIHTENPVPILIMGNQSQSFINDLEGWDLTHISPLILRLLHEGR